MRSRHSLTADIPATISTGEALAHQPHFRPCLHRGVIGTDAHAAIAAITGDICTVPSSASSAPPRRSRKRPADGAAPQLPTGIFPITARLLGDGAFREVWAEFAKVSADWLASGRGFADYLRAHRYGRGLPAISDLALLELTSHQVQRAADLPSIGTCCLPPDVLRRHPDLRLRLQPGWYYLKLGHTVLELLEERLDPGALQRLSVPQETHLRLMPGELRADYETLSPAAYAFETGLSKHATLATATEAARLRQAEFDGIAALQRLIEAGGVVDILLHADSPTA